MRAGETAKLMGGLRQRERFLGVGDRARAAFARASRVARVSGRRGFALGGVAIGGSRESVWRPTLPLAAAAAPGQPTSSVVPRRRRRDPFAPAPSGTGSSRFLALRARSAREVATP